MRKVVSTDLSVEQDDILIEAPFNGVVLITGPPGSGKTVMAFLRSEELAKKFDEVNLVMYNRVLRKFSSNATEQKKIKVMTMHKWTGKWWSKSTGTKFAPQIRPYVNDWDKMLDILLDKKADKSLYLKKLNWNHLVIDEGQDFDNKRYQFLDQVRTFFKKDDAPSLTILADENQMLHDTNSTLKQIRDILKIKDEKNIYFLTKNYRNTDQINKLMDKFYVGAETGRAEPSGKKGPVPKLVFSKGFSETVKYICRYAKNHQNQEIAVILNDDNNQVRAYFIALEEELGQDEFNVQTFVSGSYSAHAAEKLDFDKEGTVTVLNRASCKGLEFDAVFIPGMASMQVNDAYLDKFKMNMYVMCSRARENLELIFDDKSSVMDYMPSHKENILEYRDA